MINRENYLQVRHYLDYCEQVRQNAANTVKRNRAHLRHLLEWADETLLTKARTLEPFPAYLIEKKLAVASIIRALDAARQFFLFCRAEYPHLYKPISPTWLESLKPPRHMRPESRLPSRAYYTLEEVIAISQLPVDTLRLKRAQVAVCMLYISGMRAEALASIPIHCVDLVNRAVSQLPEFGVRTKNRKAAITYLIPIPELLAVVEGWHATLSEFHIPSSALWYATLSRNNERLTATEIAFEGRHNAIQRDIAFLCKRYGLKYLSPHKLRHGHVVYAMPKIKTMQQLKAVSLNVMHSSVVTTDKVYNRLVGEVVKDVIEGLG